MRSIRYSKRSFQDDVERREIILAAETMTIAMCRNDEPYLVTVNHAFDEANSCIYFHTAMEGKKIDYLRANPKVWGQIVDDRGYIQGACDHDYRSVQFKGTACFVDASSEKKHALLLMMQQLDKDPDSVEDHLASGCIDKTCVVRIDVEGYTCKKWQPIQ